MTRTATKTAQKLKIRRGDLVEVLTGKDVGRRGKVLEVIPTEGRLVVEKLNIVKRHTKPRPVKGSRGAQMTPGGVLEKEAPMRVDNVALVCPRCNEAGVGDVVRIVETRPLSKLKRWRMVESVEKAK